ncbi:hypothetical protein V6N13_145254 [Hibiscus sabdariffa]
MVGGAIATDSGSNQDFPAKLTGQVLICTAIAAFGGLMFGYDIGISGVLSIPLHAMQAYIYFFFAAMIVFVVANEMVERVWKKHCRQSAAEMSCVYKNPNAPIEDRVKDLVSRMTLQEKIGQMTQIELGVATLDDVRNLSIGTVFAYFCFTSSVRFTNYV